jgi:hypothetical protein
MINHLLIGPGDTLHVLEGIRHSVLAPDLNSFIDLRNLPAPPNVATFLGNGQFVVQFVVNSPGLAGYPLHLVDRGRVSRSFGDKRTLRPDQQFETVRAVAAAENGRVWSARINQYRIDRWRTDGIRDLTVIGDRSWFQPWSGYNPREPLESKPRPRLGWVSEDGHGRLWVAIAVPDQNWKPHSHTGEVRLLQVSPSEIYDMIIEVLDLQQGRVIARTRIGRTIYRVAGSDDLVYSSREDTDGNTLLDVWRVGIATPNRGRDQ